MAPVTVRCLAPSAASLELRGELPHWSRPIAMTARGGGLFEAELDLPVGVYQLKARSGDDRWVIDPGWRTVTSSGGEQNGVLVVGGCDEPVLHAPVPPDLTVRDDGRIVVRAALRRGAGVTLTLRCDDGLTEVDRPMRRLADAGEHLHFEAELPGAGRGLGYRFVLGDGRVIGGADGAPLRLSAAVLDEAPPPWWRDAVVYTVLVDRFRRGGQGGAWSDPEAWQRDRRAGGDLDGVIEALPYLRDLGVTALHLTPLGTSPSPHRYDAIDPRAVDPAIGGDAALDRLLAAAHAGGLRVLLDLAVTHVHRDFAPFRDVLARGPASRWWSWFQVDRWPCFDGPEPGYRHYQKGQWREPLLALDHPEVGDYLCETFARWARSGADGLRVDAAADVPLPLIARLRDAVRAVRRDAVVFGEVVPAQLHCFAPAALDAATDFATREATVGWLTGEAPASALAAVAVRQRGRGAAGPTALGFTGTHDQPRIATVTGSPARARLGLLAVALGARVPLLYYGDEIGLASTDAARDFEDSWPDRQPMPWQPAHWDEATRTLLRSALALRAQREVLRRGDEEVRALGDDVVLIRRRRLDDAIDVVLHRGAATCIVELPPGDGARVLLVEGDAVLLGHDPLRVRLGADAAIVIDRARPTDPHEAALRTHNAAIALRAYRDGHTTSPAYPTRLYLTVTEACNLRCQHCITDAPARTRGGRARQLAPWLLDALDDGFAHADYVAFTHGGESLVAPIFGEVLRRIAAARAGRPGRADVHLISNGTLLDGDRVRQLIDGGVTSLMVSLDGATAATNDRIRVLGRFDRVVANLRGAIALRAALGADLRVGVSTVLGRANASELAAIGRLCLDLGVDWLKIEETWPATPFARADLLAPGAPEAAAAMAALREAIAGHPLVLVDHLDPPAGCDTPFRAADDYANRTTFRPCRAAWEQAAIDPDGTVHAVDYAGPVLGNLLDAPLLTLWNSAAATDLRAAHLMPRFTALPTPSSRVPGLLGSLPRFTALPTPSSRVPGLLGSLPRFTALPASCPCS